jgi:hypothetical protein
MLINYRTSNESLHVSNNTATPSQMMLNKHALLLHKTYNETKLTKEQLGLNFQKN